MPSDPSTPRRLGTGIERIAAERKRQVEAEGWTAGHDDEHDDGELALVAALYATPRPLFGKHPSGVAFDPWPATWDTKWDKRPRRADGRLALGTVAQRVRCLEKAGALIAAEIDRLLRVAVQDQDLVPSLPPPSTESAPADCDHPSFDVHGICTACGVYLPPVSPPPSAPAETATPRDFLHEKDCARPARRALSSSAGPASSPVSETESDG